MKNIDKLKKMIKRNTFRINVGKEDILANATKSSKKESRNNELW
jgi:hypothetical protein